ncbi:T-complex protein 11 [Apiospora marii]|uniref:T-complex protein 11 n=1 Tax=Apiospora marii TaxID=335849 RepID=UPI0031308A9A
MGGKKPQQRPESSLDTRETWGLEPRAEPSCLEAKKLSQSCQNNHHPGIASGNPLTDLYRSHNASPPVTKAKLSELDIDRIPNNHRLRHDLNFDRDLQLRPNWDGEKGRKKQAKADEFWANLSDQLHEFITAPASSQQRLGMDRDWCLPALLKEVKEILPTLVPSQDRVYLDEGFNVELIMQQFYKGTVDLEKLASWLSSVLKTYCAPGRDMSVDEMYNKLANVS